MAKTILKKVEMRTLMMLLTLLFVLSWATGCGPLGGLDYGKAKAHFNEGDLLEKGKPYVGKLIVVKGVVTKQDLSDPLNSKIYLHHSICCNIGDRQRQAKSYDVGKTVFIKGTLKRCEEGDILLEPAIGRDPSAEFNPI